MLLRLAAVTLVLTGCSSGGTGNDGVETLSQSDPATGPDCSTAVQWPERDPVDEVRLVRFDAGDGGFGATVEVKPLKGDLELRDVPRPILGRASDAPYGPGVAPAPPVAGGANAELLTATVAAPVELVVVGGYPDESRSPLWLNASVPSVGTFSCLMAPDKAPDRTTIVEEPAPVGEPFASSQDTTLAPGERRPYPLNLHCGMVTSVRFNDRDWVLSDTPAGEVPETGAGDRIPGDWPLDENGALLGYVGLGDDDTVRYSLLDGTVLAVFELSPTPVEQPGCD